MNEELKQVVNSIPAIQGDLQAIITGLRRKNLAGAHQCAKATIEMIRTLISRYNFSSTEQMLRVVRNLGKELIQAAESEFTIGNLVRRVLFIIREEHLNQANEEALPTAPPKVIPSKRRQSGARHRSDSMTSVTSFNSTEANEAADGVSSQLQDLSFAAADAEPPSPRDFMLASSSSNSTGTNFSLHFLGLKAAVLGAISELSMEIDNVTPICQRAQDYIHAGECIFTFGYSKIVEQFLLAAGTKRRFNLIIAEDAPSLQGHKLAMALSKKNGNISVTLVPDSNIYAIMSRVNKVIFSPQAVMADGGAICSAGHLMVAIAAKEFAVPMVGVAGAFTLTPLFAHNQTSVLGQLLSPASSLHYDFDVHYGNVQVMCPAFDYVGPDLVSLFVTNDGSQLPSYVFRQLSEYYHPNDHIL